MIFSQRQLYALNTVISHTGTVTETTILTFIIPVNSIDKNGSFWWFIMGSYTNSATSKIIRIKLNGTTVFQTNLTTNASYRHTGYITNKNSLTSQITVPLASNIGTLLTGANASGLLATSINTELDVTVTITAELSGWTSANADFINIGAFQTFV